MRTLLVGWFVFLACIFSIVAQSSDDAIHIRINQLGYFPGEKKVAILFSQQPIRKKVFLLDAETGKQVLEARPTAQSAPAWGFRYAYEWDFSAVRRPGSYTVSVAGSRLPSPSFRIGEDAYGNHQEDLLGFMRQQRCGYNPFLDLVCHSRDGRTMFGPMPDSTFLDASGGWHDAGDQLKYLITSSYATAQMLLAYELYPDRFGDHTNALGQPGANGIPDVLDEAKWGLDWIHKLHPAPDQLFHQIADDRDHSGWKMPDEDPSDFGWGPNSYRVVYFATGKPQGLSQYKSQATGIANLAGRSAAAMALAARIWEKQLQDKVYAEKCLRAARSLYQLGKDHEGYQQGNSYGAPYRYNEDTWADDMEWGAAELYKTTYDRTYIAEAQHYARLAADVSWMPLDTADHYRYYPFVNTGHFALYSLVGTAFRDTLAGYYRSGIEHCLRRSQTNAFGVGVPFIWCSNNLATALITQILLYEKMTGDKRYHDLLLAQRDWLWGRNPWGTTMFTGLPADGEYPLDVHTSVWAKTNRLTPGGLVDGPISAKIWESLRGLVLTQPDEFAEFQNDFVRYYDDIGDYSTNEPTMDGTAAAILMMAHWGMKAKK